MVQAATAATLCDLTPDWVAFRPTLYWRLARRGVPYCEINDRLGELLEMLCEERHREACARVGMRPWASIRVMDVVREHFRKVHGCQRARHGFDTTRWRMIRDADAQLVGDPLGGRQMTFTDLARTYDPDHGMVVDIGHAIATLPPSLSITADLYYLRGNSMLETGRVLGVTEGGISIRLKQARDILAGTLRSYA